MKRKKLPVKTLKYLLARSGGFCENPECNIDLFTFFDRKTFIDIEQAAHIIPVGDNGPRSGEIIGDGLNIDFPENLLLLCPNCHSTIDKAPDVYPRSRLLQWKNEHENKVELLFQNKYLCKSREDFVEKIKKLNYENNYYFQSYGPTKEREVLLQSDKKKAWDDYVITKIIPNNRDLLGFLKMNDPFLTSEERAYIPLYEDHVHSFEINHLTEDKRGDVPLYPIKLFNLLIGE